MMTKATWKRRMRTPLNNIANVVLQDSSTAQAARAHFAALFVLSFSRRRETCS
jgi:hypothetical protein